MVNNSKSYNKANYKKYWGSSEAIKDRSERNAARKKLGLKKGDPRQAHHVNGISGGNGKGNLRAISEKENKRKGQKVAMINRTSKYNSFKGLE